MALILKPAKPHTTWADVLKSTLAAKPEPVNGADGTIAPYDVRRMDAALVDLYDAAKIGTYKSALERALTSAKVKGYTVEVVTDDETATAHVALVSPKAAVKPDESK